MRPAESQSLTLRTLYSELRELALAVGSTENIGDTPGSLVRKRIRRKVFLYHQYRDLDGRTRQAYLGPDDATTRRHADRIQLRGEQVTEDRQRLDSLRAAFVAAGGLVTEYTPLRVLKGFADAGLLQPGPCQAVLVGAHAFVVLGNVLGVHWPSRMQTHDVDLAGDATVALAIERTEASVPDVLTNLQMGFIPVPTLDRTSPSTSYRIRGQELRIDLLTPQTGKPGKDTLFVPALNAPAQAVRFLDYLIESPIAAVVVGRSTLVLANIPRPERFALHKLIVSESRDSAFAAKAAKDRYQATQVLETLLREAPDGLAAAKADLTGRGKKWRDRLDRALDNSRKLAPEVVDTVAAL